MDNNCIRLKYSGVGALDLDRTFDCGQCFRFYKDGDSWKGVSRGRMLTFTAVSDGEIEVRGCDEETARHFLALDDDYDAFDREILSVLDGRALEYMTGACRVGHGIRILRQDPFETLCSFILSQNNNIPRIKKLVEALCMNFGESFTDEATGEVYYSFPTPKALYDAGVDRIFELKTGFRAKYLYDAAEAVLDGRIDLDALYDMPTADAVTQLCRIKGVGVKVASCTVLFGFGKLDVFPVDVWIKRALDEDFGEGFDHTVFGRYAGIAQQYIYYCKRF